jgi:branched-subunit amino acid aminotransferase/4-amino-4-deoxychorismate lyase
MNTTDTGPWVLLDGARLARDEARISPLGEGFMFGHGLFETIKVRRGSAVFLDEHFARLETSAAELGLRIAPGLKARCWQTIELNALTAGVLKIVVFQDGAGTGELILTRTFVYPEPQAGTPFTLKLFPDARLDGGGPAWKSLNYLKNSRARAAAKAAGFDEAVFVSPEGHVLEGATTNVFVVKDGVVVTPPVSAGILPGIARAAVIRGLGPNGVRETAVTEVMLERADEIFVTNSLLGVRPVTRWESRTMEVGPEALTWKISALFREAEDRSIR